MEIKITNESGYAAQPTHKENEKSVLWQVWSVWPKEMPTPTGNKTHGDFITALKTESDEKTGSHSEIQVWGCRINSISWNYLSFSHLHPFSRKIYHLHVSSHVSDVSSHHPFHKGFSPFPRKTQLGHPWLRQLQVLHQLPHGRRFQGPTDSGQEQLQPVVFLAGETVTLHGKCRVIPDENRWDLTHIYESPITSC